AAEKAPAGPPGPQGQVRWSARQRSGAWHWGQGQRNQIFHFHPFGKLPDLLLLIKLEPGHIPLVRIVVPALVEAPGHVGDRLQLFGRIELDTPQYYAELLFAAFLFLSEIGAQHLDRKSTRLNSSHVSI